MHSRAILLTMPAALVLLGASCSLSGLTNSAEDTLTNARAAAEQRLADEATGRLVNTARNAAGSAVNAGTEAAQQAAEVGTDLIFPSPTPEEGTPVPASGTYVPYGADAFAKAKEGGTAVLFFTTSSCTSCTEAEKEFEENAAGIEAGITVLRADLDAETALAQQYGVTVPHTFVAVNADGGVVNTWVGGGVQDVNASAR